MLLYTISLNTLASIYNLIRARNTKTLAAPRTHLGVKYVTDALSTMLRLLKEESQEAS